MNLPALTNLEPADKLSLEELLLELAKYGKPGVTMLSASGWWCKCELYVTGKGVEFKIDSETKHANPRSAAAECYARVVKTLRELGVAV